MFNHLKKIYSGSFFELPEFTEQRTTLKYLHHIPNGFLHSIGIRSMEDELPYQGKEALALYPLDTNKSKAFYELHSLNKL